jgi:ribonuclease HI
LGVVIDNRLSFTKHVDYILNKAKKTLWAAKSYIGKAWGVSIGKALYVYKQILLPRCVFGGVIWWKATEKKTTKAKLTSLQGTALRLATGASSTVPIAALEALLDIPPIYVKIRMNAIVTCARLIKHGFWRGRESKGDHSFIAVSLRNYTDITNDDDTNPEWNSLRKFRVFTKNGNGNAYQNPDTNFDINIYVDASKTDKKVGVGLYLAELDEGYSYRLSDHTDSTQAETLAIRAAALSLSDEESSGKHVRIISDSLPALAAIQRAKTYKHSTVECVNALNVLSLTASTITIEWTKGHSGSTSHDMADQLAKIGCRRSEVDIVTSIPATSFKALIIEKERTLALNIWRSIKGNYGVSNILIDGYNSEIAREIAKLPRLDARTVCSLMCGSGPTKQLQWRMNKTDNPFCRYCGTMEHESVAHLLFSCSRWRSKREKILGDISKLSCDLGVHRKILKYAKATGIRDIFLSLASGNNTVTSSN